MDLLRMNIDYRQNFPDFFLPSQSLASFHDEKKNTEIERRMYKYFIVEEHDTKEMWNEIL